MEVLQLAATAVLLKIGIDFYVNKFCAKLVTIQILINHFYLHHHVILRWEVFEYDSIPIWTTF